ncbi:MAG: hypothetical protein RL023_249 [Candidatus Parcubacteria bacterium]|jgi:hypothetical protein
MNFLNKIGNKIANINWTNVFNSYHNWILGLEQSHQVDPKNKVKTITLVLFSFFAFIFISKKLYGWLFPTTVVGGFLSFLLSIIIFRGLCQFLPEARKFIIKAWNWMPHWKKILLSAASVDQELLATCPKSETVKYLRQGATMFILPTMDFFMVTYIGCSIFKMSHPWMLGLLWFFVILGLEITFTSTLERGANGKFGWKPILMRFVFALIVGCIVSTPAEIATFESEIHEQFALNLDSAMVNFDKEMEYKIDTSITKKIEEDRTYVKEKEQMMNDERDKSIGGRAPKEGPIFRSKKAEFEKADSIQKAKEAGFYKDKEKEIRKEFANRKDKWEANQANGLAAQLEALHLVEAKHPVTKYAHCMIILFFLIISMIATLSKTMTKAGPYEEKMMARKSAEKFAAETSLQVAIEQQKTILQIAQLCERSRLEQERLTEQTKLAIAQNQAAADLETARLENESLAQTQRAINQATAQLNSTTVQTVAKSRHLQGRVLELTEMMATLIARVDNLTTSERPILEKGLTQQLDKLRLELEALTA